MEANANTSSPRRKATLAAGEASNSYDKTYDPSLASERQSLLMRNPVAVLPCHKTQFGRSGQIRAFDQDGCRRATIIFFRSADEAEVCFLHRLYHHSAPLFHVIIGVNK